MSENEFSGPLQDRFGDTGLNNLIALDLSSNLFDGTIPSSLEDLDSIRVIRLQYNMFTGPVPNDICNIRGPQILTLLEVDCGGDPIPNECSCCTSCCDRDTKTCAFVDTRRLANEGRIVHSDEDDWEEAHFSQFHERVIPKRRKLQSDDCTARARWDRESGRLVMLTD